MDAVNFPESTGNLAAPPGFTEEEVFTLPINHGFYFIRNFHPVACITSCWRLSDEDWQKWRPDKLTPEAWLLFKPTAPDIYLSIMGFGMPAVSLDCGKIWDENFDKSIGKYYHQNGKFPPEYQKAIMEDRQKNIKPQ